MRTFNLGNYFGTMVKQKFGRLWYLSWYHSLIRQLWEDGPQLSYPVYRSLCWKHNRYLVLVNNAVAHSKQVSTSTRRDESLFWEVRIPTYDCYLLCWISEKKKNKKEKGYTLRATSTYVCEINNTKTIKRKKNSCEID